MGKEQDRVVKRMKAFSQDTNDSSQKLKQKFCDRVGELEDELNSLMGRIKDVNEEVVAEKKKKPILVEKITHLLEKTLGSAAKEEYPLFDKALVKTQVFDSGL